MKRTFSSWLLVLLTLALILGCQATHEVPQYTIQDFLGTTNFSGASFSPDNSKILVSSNQTGIFNAYAIPVAGGEPTPLTNATENSIFVRGYFPNDERFLYISDKGGNELSHIYVQELNGPVTDLTPGDGLKASFYGWSWDDKSFYIGSNERDQRYFDVYEYSVDDYQRKMIFQNNGGYNFADVSPDRKYIALSKTETRTNNSYEVYKGDDKLSWYDPFPYPHSRKLARTHPHHKHVPPDIKHNRIPAPNLSFKELNLIFLIKEIESSFLKR
ncbi:MAG: TolB family protein [bacterium]